MVFLWTALYVCAILFANLTLNHFIPLPVFGLLSVGTLFFGAVFTLRDRLHDFGLKAVYRAIALALVVNFVMGWVLMESEPNRMRFIIASFTAILISELTDTAVFQSFMKKSWLYRALSSNAVSIPLDTFLFNIMAFYGIMSWRDIGQIIFGDLVFKAVIATVVAFAIYYGLKKPKQILNA